MKEINGVFLNKDEWDEYKKIKQIVEEMIFYYKNNSKEVIAKGILDPEYNDHLGNIMDELEEVKIP